jgi:hypothetical protein
MRICKSCLNELPEISFSLHPQCKDGYNPRCKNCVRNKIKTQYSIKVEKSCTKCRVLKPLTDFSVSKYKKDGRSSRCLECNRKKKEIIPKGYKKCNNCKNIIEIQFFRKCSSLPDGLDSRCKSCKSNGKPKGRAKKYADSEFYKICTECTIPQLKTNFDRNKNAKDGLTSNCKVCRKKYRDSKKEYNKAYNKQYKKDNKEGLNEKNAKYLKKRIKEDLLFKLQTRLRENLYKYLKGTKKSKRTVEILGCTFEEFKNHIESQFESWMSWDNYGNCETFDYKCSWHLDHIIPISLAKTEEDIYLLNHWSNFQPLCSRVNSKDKNCNLLLVSNIINKDIKNFFEPNLKQFL